MSCCLSHPFCCCWLLTFHAGTCDGMTYSEIKQTMPEEFSRRQVDKLAYRYPRGESYLDVIARIEPMIIEMERHREPVLIIAHQGILRVIFAFYSGLAREQCPHVKIPLNSVIRLQPAAVTCTKEVRPISFCHHHHPTTITTQLLQTTHLFPGHCLTQRLFCCCVCVVQEFKLYDPPDFEDDGQDEL